MHVHFWPKKLIAGKQKDDACMKKLIHAPSLLAWAVPFEWTEGSKICVRIELLMPSFASI